MHQPTTTEATAPTDCGLRERKKQQTRSAIHRSALALVTNHGLAGVTVEQICADAGVSPRTFFNYFPSKADAALGLPVTTVPDEARAVFLGSEGPLVADLCDLVAQTVSLPADRQRMKELVRARPEMVPAMLQWMAHARQTVLAVAAERVGEDTGRTATTLVMAAVIESAHRSADGSRDELAARLRAVVGEMGRLAAA
ncbi:MULTISPECIES: TetR family transcriptional regulator [unclassified Curtobacterium]|uniref:TetR/AcrR family transcriptional regulator n=1 Tax=unclassified Curtobacterium TaxID=257496 RepID=UPI000DA879B8|nr:MULTISPECIES: TetR family transcriptional regulator [unclassified Curtobacterium]PZF31560.1 TetR family transcriptional regulator [Curtobacterium sp. MCPF17_051]WIB70409.1 TetR family transcriptional regulator [Curtobacterium sp. MCBD17_026]